MNAGILMRDEMFEYIIVRIMHYIIIAIALKIWDFEDFSLIIL